MNFVLEKKQAQFNQLFGDWIEKYFKEYSANSNMSDVLLESQKYSLISEGKKFRPFLAFLTFSMYSDDFKKIRSLCLSLEMIHTYSLIHDDLPCMDNDDVRRGKPSNHKAFSEDIALLAGDGLLSDVFALIATDSDLSYEIRTKMVAMLSRQIGSFGMVAGQVKDMKADKNIKLSDLKQIHNLKTANLIEAAALGAGLAANVSDSEIGYLMEFSHCLGMAFQIKDDIMDSSDKKEDFKNYVAIIGLEKTKQELENYSNRAKAALEQMKKFDLNTTFLAELIKINMERNS